MCTLNPTPLSYHLLQALEYSGSYSINTTSLLPIINYYSTPMRLFLHFIENANESAPIDTYIADVEPTFTLEEILKLSIINCRKQLSLPSLSIFKEFAGKALESNATVESTFKENDDVFIVFSNVAPIKVEKVSNQHFDTLTKYSFSDGDKKVQVYLDLPDIGDLAPEQIQSRFLDKSFEIKIHGYKGKNYIFAVPKTQCSLDASKSTVVKKPHKLVINIAKNSTNDHWHSLYKSKAIGETDD